MTSTNQEHERIHSLDALRALMVLLGLVVHSSMSYGVNFHLFGWKIQDPQSTNYFFDILVLFLHDFRMPVFFVIAGFFGALLFYDRSPSKMILNRLKRILLPFVLALVILWPLILFTHSYHEFQIADNPNSFNKAIGTFTDGSVIKVDTGHLWFLYYLIYFSIFGWGLALIIGHFQVVGKAVKYYFELLHRHLLVKLFILGLATYICFTFMAVPLPTPSFSLMPHFPTFLFYFVFYLYGWLLFKSKHLIIGFMKNIWLLFLIAILFFLLQLLLSLLVLFEQVEYTSISFMLTVINSIIPWLFIPAIIGLFMKYKSTYSPKARYISDASYWVYLTHFPIIIFIPCLLLGFDLSPFIKIFIVLFFTIIICFLSYHFIVRSTFIGKLLNGRKYVYSTKQHKDGL